MSIRTRTVILSTDKRKPHPDPPRRGREANREGWDKGDCLYRFNSLQLSNVTPLYTLVEEGAKRNNKKLQ